MNHLTKNKTLLGYESLSSYPDIFHFVTTRQGGCSKGDYASFNCSPFSDDDLECVRHNQEILLSAFPQKPSELVIPYQTHGIEVCIINTDYIQASLEERSRMLHGVDALVTDKQGYCLCVSTADCIPILLYDTRRKVIAAVHAGWRGTVAGILKRTLEVMEETYSTNAEDIIACIGPGISLQSFEVGDEVYDTFSKSGFDMQKITQKNKTTNKWHIDLWEANRLQLLEAGVLPEHIDLSGICTYTNHEQLFSARRLGIKSGRILSGIMLMTNQ